MKLECTAADVQLQIGTLVEDKVEALLDAQAERTMSPRLTKGSTFRLSKKNHPSQIEKCLFRDAPCTQLVRRVVAG